MDPLQVRSLSIRAPTRAELPLASCRGGNSMRVEKACLDRLGRRLRFPIKQRLKTIGYIILLASCDWLQIDLSADGYCISYVK